MYIEKAVSSVCAEYNDLFHLIYAEYDTRFHLVTSHDSIGPSKLLVAWTSGVASAPKIINNFLIRLYLRNILKHFQ